MGEFFFKFGKYGDHGQGKCFCRMEAICTFVAILVQWSVQY